MKQLQPLKSLILLVLLTSFLVSCSKDEVDSSIDVTNITVKFKSTVGQLDNVYMDIEDIAIKVSNSNEAERWVSLGVENSGVHNACSFSDSKPLLLIDNLEIDANYLHEIRLVLGDGNFMNINNVLHSLDVSNTGNANPSNLIETQLNPKRRYDITIDINVDASISYDESENMMVLNPQLYTAIRQIEY